MPEILVSDNELLVVHIDSDSEIGVASIDTQTLVVVHTGTENVKDNISAAFFTNHYRNQVNVLGTIDGVNTTFTLPDSNNVANSERLWYGGSDLIKGVDYTISGHTITMLWPPINSLPFVASYYFGLA